MQQVCGLVAVVWLMAGVAAAQSASSPQPDSSPTLRGLVFLGDPAAVRAEGWPVPADGPSSAIDVSRVPSLNDPRLMKTLAPRIGQPFDVDVFLSIRGTIARYFAGMGEPFVRIVLPKQDVTNGVVQVVIVKGRVGTVKVEGNRWFSASEIRRALDLRSGDPLDARRVGAAVRALNQNPYRHVAPVMQAGTAAGTTDVTLQVQDRVPLSPSFSIGNTGNESTGEVQMNAGLDWGDAMRRGDDLNFRYTTATDLHVLHQYSGGYTAHLPWGDLMTVNGSYSRTTPVSAPGASAVGSVGTMENVSPRYVRTIGAGQLSAGFDWMRSNNNLLFGGESIFASSSDVEQFVVDYSRTFTDRHGSTTASAGVVYSPGGLSAGNSDAAFDAQREGATARYAIVRLNADRATQLARGFVWDVRGSGQIANAPLLSSQQLTFGGDGSIRGFETFAAAADNGVVVNMELQAPPLHLNLPRHLGLGAEPPDALSPFAFVDYGAGTLRGVDGSLVQLTTVGPGVRYQFSRYASVALSYGFILQHAGLATTSTGRVQFQVSASY
jgi:hemolysin activation/secretion protein